MKKLISLQHIVVKSNHHEILSNISFTLSKGQILTLIGPNGAGKSTLVRVVLGLLKPTSGIITWVKDLTIGYVPQKITLNSTLPLTVYRFLLLGGNKSAKELHEVLSLVNARPLLSKSMLQLSGGELQRVLLAQALLKQPQLLVLDEPTQGVDIKGQIALYELIEKTKERFGCGILLVSHDLHFVMAKTDLVICLNRHICCHGEPEKVKSHPEFLSLFGQSETEQLALYHHRHNHEHDLKGKIIKKGGSNHV